MRRAKVGDVYCVNLPNGCKLFQWAYDIPRHGRYIRVLDGIYQTIPSNLDILVTRPHQYVIDFPIHKACRVGLIQFLGNYPVPEEYPFPKYQIRFRVNSSKRQLEAIHVMHSGSDSDVWQWFYVDSIDKLPEEYRGVTLLNMYLPVNWILYLFDVGFDLHHPERYPLGEDPEKTLEPYNAIIDRVLGKK